MVGKIKRVRSMRRKEKGFTIIEVLIAMSFFLLCSIGLMTFTMMTLKERKIIERRHQAYAFANDMVERLRFLPSNSDLVEPQPSHEGDHVKLEDGKLVYCDGGQQVDINSITNPIGGGTLYLYDKDHDGNLDSSEVNNSANPEIDHPTTNVADYNGLMPIRQTTDGTTFYCVWAVRYFPCNSSNQSKIFIKVYWIEPEPQEENPQNVVSGITNGKYQLKEITIATDRAYKVVR